MNTTGDHKKFKDPHARSSVQLTHEEIRVLKECRVNSVYYRGIPFGIVSLIVARGAVQSGYFPRLQRWSGAFYVGMFGLGFFSGIASYREECFKKIMSLENSVLKEQFQNFRKRHGLPTEQSSESEFTFDQSTPHDEVTGDNSSTDGYDSPLLQRMQNQSKWSEIRDASRQSHAPAPRSNQNGLSYEELKQRNRSRTSETSASPDDETRRRDIDMENFKSHNFSEDRSTFSKDDDPKLTSYSTDTSYHHQAPSINTRPRKTFAEATGRKNAYGDEME